MSGQVIIAGGGQEAEHLAEVLSQAGWTVLRADPEGLPAEVTRCRPRLVLLHLPDGSEGREQVSALTRRLQTTAYGALVPILLYGPEPAPSGVEIHRLGGDLYLALPAPEETIVRTVTRLMGRNASDRSPAATTPAPPPSAAGAPAGGNDPAEPDRRPSSRPQPPPAAPAPASEPALAANAALEALLSQDADLDPLALAESLARQARRSEPDADSPPVARPAPGAAASSAADPLDAGDSLIDPDALPDSEDLASLPPLDPLDPFDPLDSLDAALSLDAAHPDDPASDPDGLVPSPRIERPPASRPAADAAPPPAEAASSGRGPDAADGEARLPEGGEAKTRRDPAAALEAQGEEVGLDLQLLGGGGGPEDTVAIQIRKTIQSFERQIPRPAAQAGPHGSAPSTLPESAARPSTAPGKRKSQAPRPDGAATVTPSEARPDLPPAPEDIDLDALDRDTVAGVSLADPDEIIGRLDSDLNPAAPPAQDDAIAMGSQVDAPLPSDTRAMATPAAVHERATPLPPEPLEASSDASGADTPGPVASPYDLPPVVASVQPHRGDPEQDFVDTVPGRRTAVVANVSPRPLEDSAPGSEPAAFSQDRATPEPPAEGDLSEIDPARLLWRIWVHRVTGTLEAFAEDGRLSFTFSEGAVRLAASSRPGDRMLTLLERSGLLAPAAAREVEQEVARSGRRVGAVLLDRGLLKPAELVPTVREHLTELVYGLFGLATGRFTLGPEIRDEDEVVYLDVPTTHLVIEGVLRAYSEQRVETLAGGTRLTAVRHPSFDEGLLAGAPLAGRDWRLLDRLDGHTPLSDLADRVGLSTGRAVALCWALHAMDQVTVLPLEPGTGSRSARPPVSAAAPRRLPEDAGGIAPQERPPEGAAPRGADAPAAPPSSPAGSARPAELREPGDAVETAAAQPPEAADAVATQAADAGATQATDADYETDARRVAERLAVVAEGTYYDCLGIPPGADADAVLRAYRKLSERFSPARLHPDVAAQYADGLEQIRQVLREAYEILTDPELREAYARHVVAPEEPAGDTDPADPRPLHRRTPPDDR